MRRAKKGEQKVKYCMQEDEIALLVYILISFCLSHTTVGSEARFCFSTLGDFFISLFSFISVIWLVFKPQWLEKSWKFTQQFEQSSGISKNVYGILNKTT